MSVRIAPSILSADFAALGEAIAAVERGGADLIHVDVMDGHFVPNLTIGPPVVRSIKRVATVPLDVHLMIMDPDRYIDAFADAGAAMMSVHVEVVPHLNRTVHAIKALGVQAGVVLNPSTPVVLLEEIAARAARTRCGRSAGCSTARTTRRRLPSTAASIATTPPAWWPPAPEFWLPAPPSFTRPIPSAQPAS
jgi:hypothetical protein